MPNSRKTGPEKRNMPFIELRYCPYGCGSVSRTPNSMATHISRCVRRPSCSDTTGESGLEHKIHDCDQNLCTHVKRVINWRPFADTFCYILQTCIRVSTICMLKPLPLPRPCTIALAAALSSRLWGAANDKKQPAFSCSALPRPALVAVATNEGHIKSEKSTLFTETAAARAGAGAGVRTRGN